jgi:hypothetical protein
VFPIQTCLILWYSCWLHLQKLLTAGLWQHAIDLVLMEVEPTLWAGLLDVLGFEGESIRWDFTPKC